jgi:hypothetical protein
VTISGNSSRLTDSTALFVLLGLIMTKDATGKFIELINFSFFLRSRLEVRKSYFPP